MKRRITSKKQAKQYIEILTDFGWKYYFGREENKINLINFLNSLLEGEHVIADLHYANVEEGGEHSGERKVIFDLRCIGEGGEHFLVEMQLQNQDFFFDRAVTYTSRTISRLAKKGVDGNGYELPPVYFVAVLGFQLDKANDAKHYYSAKIVDQFDQEVLYEKLSYKMLVLPNFNKSKTELSTIMDQWMYLMKHLNEIDELPNYLDKRIFSRIFEVGEVANLTPTEHMAYISSLDRKRDYNNTIAFAKKEAMAEGEAKGERKKALETARKMLGKGFSKEDIQEVTGLSIEDIELLK